MGTAFYRLESKVVQRSQGGSSVAAAAYRASESITDERTGERHDYTRKRGHVASQILTPKGAPEWTQDRAQLWNAVEQVEKRKDAQVARELLISLPRELPESERLAVVCDFIQKEFVSLGMIADVNLHNDKAADGGENPHAHVMLTMRPLDGDKFAKTKAEGRVWNAMFSGGVDGKYKEGFANSKGKGNGWVAEKAGLEGYREKWAQAVNAALTDSGSSARVDHRSLKDRGIDRDPTPNISKSGFHHRNSTGQKGKEYQKVLRTRMQNHVKRGSAFNATGKPARDFERQRLRKAQSQKRAILSHAPPQARSRDYDQMVRSIYGEEVER